MRPLKAGQVATNGAFNDYPVMDAKHPPRRSQYDSGRPARTVPKWRVTTGALLGAALLGGAEILWRGVTVDWALFSDRAQEMITMELVLPSIVVGGLCGTLVCLIRNQRKNAGDRYD